MVGHQLRLVLALTHASCTFTERQPPPCIHESNLCTTGTLDPRNVVSRVRACRMPEVVNCCSAEIGNKGKVTRIDASENRKEGFLSCLEILYDCILMQVV